jgi:hypothetical protein
VRPVYVPKEERILGLVFCTMVALLLFELLLRRAGLPLSGQQFLALCAPLALLVLLLQDGSARRHVTGVAPPVAALLQAQGWPAAAAYAQLTPRM